jgi:formate C-acetyltransferase
MVYEREEISLADLVKAVKSDFEGNEALRLRLGNAATHYGNDDDATDAIAQTLFLTATEAVHSLNDGTVEDKFVNSYFSYTAHVSLGEAQGATPDGRRAGEPLSDGLGPVQGKDAGGPTKLFNSLLKLDYRYLTGANAINCKISPSLVDTKTGTMALKNLIKAFLKDGGPQVQINLVRREDLIEAQKNPGKYRDIVVRIAGFCEYFVNLDHSQQNEIITRTEHAIS